MNHIPNISPSPAAYEEQQPARCPLCGRPITLLYPEICPGIRYAHCQHGHKVRLQQEGCPERNAG